MIDETIRRIVTLHVSQGGLARRSDLKLLAKGPGKGCRPQPALPVIGVPAIFHFLIFPVILHKHETGHCPLHRMANIVDMIFITVGPPMEVADGPKVVSEKGAL